MRYLFLFVLVFAIQFLYAQDSTKGSSPEIISQHYLELMNDHTVNFYTVVNAAEAYFSTVDKSKKGSGWKQYQRWKSLNEYKYYPSGDRSTTAPDFAWKQYQLFIKNNPKQQKVGLNEWQSLGPSSIDSITKHYAVGLGRIEDFYVNPNNENQI